MSWSVKLMHPNVARCLGRADIDTAQGDTQPGQTVETLSADTLHHISIYMRKAISYLMVPMATSNAN